MKFQYLQRAYIIVLLFVPQVTLFCQEYQPMPAGDARWDIARCWGFYPGGWHDEYAVTMDGSDTTINGKIYNQLFLTTHHLPGTEFDSVYVNYLGAMREANRQVFIISEYLTLDTIERMVYDFNDVSPGDTVYTQILTNGLLEFIPHIVVSEDEVVVGQEVHRTISLSDVDGNFMETWIEGVGSNLGVVYASYWLLTDNSYDLNCFYEGRELQYTNPAPEYMFCTAPLPDITCEPLSTSIPEVGELPVIQVYPNPAFDFIHFEFPVNAGSIEIINTEGKLMLKQQFSRTLAISTLPVGVYMVQLRDGEGQMTGYGKFVKM